MGNGVEGETASGSGGRVPKTISHEGVSELMESNRQDEIDDREDNSKQRE